MYRTKILGVILALALSPNVALAQTGPVDNVANTTQVIGSDGAVTTSANGQYSYIGDNYNTSGFSVYAVNNSDANGGWLTDPNASYSLHVSIGTTFDGADTLLVNGQTINVGYADIMIGAVGSTTPLYAVTLGGNMEPGIYGVTGVETSLQTMGGYSGISYGAGFSHGGGIVSPVDVLLTSGYALPGTVTDSYANGILNVTVAGLTEDEISALSNDFSVEWGTGWCANGAIFADDVAIPEPVSFGLLLIGVSLIGLISWRNAPLV